MTEARCPLTPFGLRDEELPDLRHAMHRVRSRAAARALRLLALAAVTACASAPEPATPPAPLLVATFNIRYGTAPDGDDAWPNRRALVFEVLRQERAELVGVQEALRFQLDEMRRAFPHWREVGVGRDDGREAGEYAAILYDGRRLELLEQGHFWFSATPEVPGSTSWGNRIPRICSWARFGFRDSDATFYAYNVHWDHESQPSRDSSAVLLLRRIAGRRNPADPVIVTGDFNAGEANSAFRMLLSGGSVVEGAPPLIDAFRAEHPYDGAVGTYHGFRGDRSGEKIDAILVSRHWQTAGAAIVHTAEGGRYPSDHFPVVARLQLRD